jgi:hypothetical protein
MIRRINVTASIRDARFKITTTRRVTNNYSQEGGK